MMVKCERAHRTARLPSVLVSAIPQCARLVQGASHLATFFEQVSAAASCGKPAKCSPWRS